MLRPCASDASLRAASAASGAVRRALLQLLEQVGDRLLDSGQRGEGRDLGPFCEPLHHVFQTAALVRRARQTALECFDKLPARRIR